MLIFTTVTKLKAIIFKNAKYFEEWVPVTTLLERRHGIVHLLFNKKKKKADMYFTNWSRSQLNCMNLCLFNKLYLIMDINSTQELCVNFITKDCHVRFYVFNIIYYSKTVVLQCNMALVWWLKTCFMLTVHTYTYVMIWDVFYNTFGHVVSLQKLNGGIAVLDLDP